MALAMLTRGKIKPEVPKLGGEGPPGSNCSIA